jgi:hypothetical protein
VLVAECASLLQVVGIWDNNACLTLDGLDEESGQVGAGRFEGFAEGSLVIVCDGLLCSGNRAADTGQIRTIVFARLGVRG